MIKEVEVNEISIIGTCKICGAKRDVYNTSDFIYGEALVITDDGKYYAYINHFEDTAHNEVVTILKNILGMDISEVESAECFFKTFGASCDLVNGVKVDINRTKKSCVNCGSEQLEYDYSHEENVTVKLPLVTHEAWDKLNSEEKEKLIYDKLKLKGCI